MPLDVIVLHPLLREPLIALLTLIASHSLQDKYEFKTEYRESQKSDQRVLQVRYLGSYASEQQAARAFDQEAITLRGVGMELNLPHEAHAFRARLRLEEAAAAANGRGILHFGRMGCGGGVERGRRIDHDLVMKFLKIALPSFGTHCAIYFWGAREAGRHQGRSFQP